MRSPCTSDCWRSNRPGAGPAAVSSCIRSLRQEVASRRPRNGNGQFYCTSSGPVRTLNPPRRVNWADCAPERLTSWLPPRTLCEMSLSTSAKSKALASKPSTPSGHSSPLRSKACEIRSAEGFSLGRSRHGTPCGASCCRGTSSPGSRMRRVSLFRSSSPLGHTGVFAHPPCSAPDLLHRPWAMVSLRSSSPRTNC